MPSAKVLGLGACSALLAWACAQGSNTAESSGGDGGFPGSGGASDGGSTATHSHPSASHGAGGSGGSGSGGGSVASACTVGRFATSYELTQGIVCETIDSRAQAAINGGCAVYFGQSDGCVGCAPPPAKWGRAGGTNCANGVGANDTCSTFTLGGAQVTLFGLNPSGDLDDNDTLFYGFHCGSGTSAPSHGKTCGPGEAISGIVDGEVTCRSVSHAVLSYVRSNCSLYAGERDGCTGCTTAPAKWGYTNDAACQNGVGASDTCNLVTLGSEEVNLFGLNVEGDVDDNDTLYVGLHCVRPAPVSGLATGTCPEGQFVVGLNANGSVQCASPAVAVADYFSAHCAVTFGWQDGCTGCSTAPAKWGSTRDSACSLGVGLNDTCTTPSLGGTTVRLFGLNTGGNVDDNDKLHIGFTCL